MIGILFNETAMFTQRYSEINLSRLFSVRRTQILEVLP